MVRLRDPAMPGAVTAAPDAPALRGDREGFGSKESALSFPSPAAADPAGAGGVPVPPTPSTRGHPGAVPSILSFLAPSLHPPLPAWGPRGCSALTGGGQDEPEQQQQQQQRGQEPARRGHGGGRRGAAGAAAGGAAFVGGERPARPRRLPSSGPRDGGEVSAPRPGPPRRRDTSAGFPRTRIAA